MTALRVLQIEDVEDDALLVALELRRGGWQPQCTRVDTVQELRAALAQGEWDLITSDFGLPRFDAPSALAVVQEAAIDVPFIIVSGTIPDIAVSSAMKAGAHDFVSKRDLQRLVPAVRRELNEAKSRHERRLAEARFQTLARSLDGTVVTVNRDLAIDGVYGRGLVHGESPALRYIGRQVREFFAAEEADLVDSACKEVLAGADVVHELTRGRPEGDVTIQLTVSPMRGLDDEVCGLVGYLRDVTGQKKMQAQVVASDRMATIGSMAAGVAHEINNPLSALLSNLHLLERDLRRLEGGYVLTPGMLREMIDVLQDAGTAAGIVRTIAGDLRTFSRQVEEMPSPVLVTDVLESALRIARNQIQPRARVVRAYDDVPPALAVPSSLGQVYLNLLVNAAQAIPPGDALRHEVRLRVYVDEAAQRVVTEVSDTGAGISDVVMQRLFTPFFTTKPTGVGTGLGLSICKRIVDGFGGEIFVESTLGEGATFRVSLPIAPR